MSTKPGLSALKAQISQEKRPPVFVPEPSEEAPAQVVRSNSARKYPTYREGKVPIGGYFSPELQRVLHQLALDESELGKPKVKIQSLLGEAIDLLLRDRGKSAFGER
jgi:hypothetical protein